MGVQRKKTPVLENKKARRNYEILETIEAGLVLKGTEVKSLRDARASLADAHVVPEGRELNLVNMRIDRYQNAGFFNHEERRNRKLLLHRKEIVRMISSIREKRMAVIPLKLYFNQKGRVKVLLGLGKGKRLYDRRQEEKRSEAKKEMARALKEANR